MPSAARAMVLMALLLLLLAPLGCKGGPATVPVSGKVMMDKKPLANALVRFQPADNEGGTNPDSFGKTDEQGNFTLKTTVSGKDYDGAMVGKHKVYISQFDRDANKENVPARYSVKGALTFTVPEGGTKEANFLDLTSN